MKEVRGKYEPIVLSLFMQWLHVRMFTTGLIPVMMRAARQDRARSGSCTLTGMAQATHRRAAVAADPLQLHKLHPSRMVCKHTCEQEETLLCTLGCKAAESSLQPQKFVTSQRRPAGTPNEMPLGLAMEGPHELSALLHEQTRFDDPVQREGFSLRLGSLVVVAEAMAP